MSVEASIYFYLFISFDMQLLDWTCSNSRWYRRLRRGQQNFEISIVQAVSCCILALCSIFDSLLHTTFVKTTDVQLVEIQREKAFYKTKSQTKTKLNEVLVNRRTKSFMEVLTSNTNLEITEIPGGIFMMGSSDNDLNSTDDERPQHQVEIQPFFMGKISCYPKTMGTGCYFFLKSPRI